MHRLWAGDTKMNLREILERVPYDVIVTIKARHGTNVLTEPAGVFVEWDDMKGIRLDDFELVTELHLPGQKGGTLADLMAKDLEPIRFVVDDLIPEGLILLAGKPKLGKSWLALGFSLAICAGEDTLGHRTDPADVLYIALEDGERRLQDRVRILGGIHLHPDALNRFHYRTEWPGFDNGGFDQMETWMIDHPDTRLIVVDTYGKLRGPLPGKDRYTEEYDLLGRLQTFATKHRVAVVLVHHLRKQAADDWLEQLSGTQAVTGAADTLLGLFRERGQMDATLRVVSREIDERDLALKFEEGRWSSMGDAFMYRVTTERSAVLEALEALGGEARVSDIAALADKTAANTSKLLTKLEVDQLVRRVRYGVYATVETVEVVEDTPPSTPGKVVEVVTSTSTTSTKSTDTHDQREHMFGKDDSNPDPW
jgi:hypothetical protein